MHDQIPFATVLDSIADGVFTVDPDWNITFFNRAAEEITGVSASEALGRQCRDVFHSSLCDGACALKSCLANGSVEHHRSVYILRPDGARIPISISAAPLHDEHGHLIGGVETFRDESALHEMRREMESAYTLEDMVGKSRPMRRLFGLLPQIAESGASAMLEGESGTGKELVARALHNLGPRRDQPFVAVNCAALPDTLLESELFGYKAGAFTDARKDKPGRFEQARGGTIFLDEIGDMPLGLQAKLLRVLQEKVFEPLGGLEPVHTDVRVISATNQDLETLVQQGDFRQDLFFRLNVVRLRLPALRERPEDIPLLAAHFVRHFNLLTGKEITGITDQVLGILLHHSFPGNIRELENILEYAFILCPGGLIHPEHLPEYLQPATETPKLVADEDVQASPSTQTPPMPSEVPLLVSPGQTMEQIKCQAARAAVARHQGAKMAACRELNISKDTLRRILQRCSQNQNAPNMGEK
jgi:sigma-54 dependent transcriptional regulator, acetoin dehydrogenase operon transcriptional activator AcoR